MTGATCPRCGAIGRKLTSLTAKSMLREEALARLGDGTELRFCKTGDCEIVYFGDDAESFFNQDLRVAVFQKSRDPQRLVCYCFEHTVCELEDEVLRTGDSAVPDAITQKCKQGLDRCEETNPQGSCCLGNVRQVVNSAKAAKGTANDNQDGKCDSCCQ